MADTKIVDNPNRSEGRSVLAFFKWIVKAVLTHAGCLAQDDPDDDDLGLHGSFRERLTNDERVHGDACASGNTWTHSDLLDDAVLTWRADHCLDNRRRNNDNSTNNSGKDITTTTTNNNNNNNFLSYISKSGNNSRNYGFDPFDDTYREKSNTMSFQNCTMPSFDRNNGGSYWASFSEKSFNKGSRFKVYSGIFNGDGRKRGDKLVVKVFKERAGTASMCDCEVRKSNKARDLARDFNQLNGHRARIRTSNIYSASMDEVSVLKNIFFRGSRKLTTKEEVLFEDDLRVDDEKPNKMRKLTSFMDHYGRQSICKSRDLEAFVHFSYHQTNGQLVVAGLEGVDEANGFVIKTPTIHSRQKEYGSSDKGVDGIRLVFKHHVCNEMCRDMMKPRSAEEEEEEEELDNYIETVSEARGSQTPERSENILTQSSVLSQQTENMSGFIEPTAPNADECDEDFFDDRNNPIVADWILGEHARRYHFIDTRRSDPAEGEWRRGEEAEKREEGGRGEEIVCEGRPDIESQMSVDSRACDLAFRTEDSVSSMCFSPDEADRKINWPQNDERLLRYSASTARSTSGIGTFAGSVEVDNPESPAVCPNAQPSFNMQRQTSAPVTPSAQACASSFQAPLTPDARILLPHWRSPGGDRPDLPPSNAHGWVESPPSYHESQNAYLHQWLQEYCYRERSAPYPSTDYDNNGNTIVHNLGHRM